MFSQSITESDAFLDMPLSSQMLYIHLGMNADDDGFVQPKRIVRMSGANNDDLNILIAKRFLILFPSGVAVIKHWLINNTLQKDRVKSTNYVDELTTITTKKNKAYTERIKRPRNNRGMYTNSIQNDSKMERSIDKIRLDKYSIDKISNVPKGTLAEKPPEKFGKPEINILFDYWEQKIGMPISSRQTQNRRAANNLLKKHGEDKTKQLIDGVALTLDDRYAPRICDFYDLQNKLNELLIWGRKRGVANATAEF